MFYKYQVEGTDFSLCLVIADADGQASVEWNRPYDDVFIYHRIDLKPPSEFTVCNYYKRSAVKGISGCSS